MIDMELENGWQHSRLRRTPSWLIVRAATLANRFVAPALHAIGANKYEYSVLSALKEHESATQAELGRYCDIDRSDIAAVVADLETAGCVERHSNPKDRRQKIVRLTSAGHARINTIADTLSEAQELLLAEMSPEDRATLSRILVQLLDTHSVAPPE